MRGTNRSKSPGQRNREKQSEKEKGWRPWGMDLHTDMDSLPRKSLISQPILYKWQTAAMKDKLQEDRHGGFPQWIMAYPLYMLIMVMENNQLDQQEKTFSQRLSLQPWGKQMIGLLQYNRQINIQLTLLYTAGLSHHISQKSYLLLLLLLWFFVVLFCCLLFEFHDFFCLHSLICSCILSLLNTFCTHWPP